MTAAGTIPVKPGSIVIVRFHDGRKQQVELQQQLGRTGLEGAAFRVRGQNTVVKIFKQSDAAKSAEKRRKLEAMIDPSLSPRTKGVAWPLGIVEGAADGYLMPLVTGSQLLIASEGKLRAKKGVHFDLYEFYFLARNVASAVQSVHDAGHVVGDFKEQNCLFDEKDLNVNLIDTDSFGISRDGGSTLAFKVDATTREFIPREYHRRTSDVGKPHDRFAIAVFFYSLFFGQHPFTAGVRTTEPETALEVAIASGAWLHSRNHRIKPTKTDPPFAVVGPEIRALFHRAFDDGHYDPALRPEAGEWVRALSDASNDLSWCKYKSLHVFDVGAGPNCPWCQMRPDRFTAPPRHVSRTRARAIEDLRKLAQPEAQTLQAEPLDRIRRRLAANEAFRKAPELQTVVSTLQRIEEHARQVERSLRTLVEASSNDIALIAAAERIGHDDAVLRSLRSDPKAAGLLDRAERFSKVYAHLRAGLGQLKPDGRGRVSLADERTAINLLDGQSATLSDSAGMSAYFLPRRQEAEARVVATEALQRVLSATAIDKPSEALHATLATHGTRLAELADTDIADALAAARSIDDLFSDIGRPAADVPDHGLVATWDAKLAALSYPILDVPGPPAGLSLRASIDAARRGLAATAAFETVLREARDHPDLLTADQHIVAADPTAAIPARSRSQFAAGPAGQALAASTARLRAIIAIEKAAELADRDLRDTTIVQLWHANADRDRLNFSPATQRLLQAARDRMGLFARIDALATESPPADERLVSLAAAIDPQSDLGTLTLSNGQTLATRLTAARVRLGARDAIAAAIAAAHRTSPTLADETAIVVAANAASGAAQVAPTLLDGLNDRIGLARRRVEGHGRLVAGLKQRDGDAVRATWTADKGLLGDFAPVRGLTDEIARILALQAELDGVIQVVQRDLTADATIIATIAAHPDVLDLAGATTPRPELGRYSLRAVAEHARMRHDLLGRDDNRLDLLDRAEARPVIARLADVWRTSFGFDHPAVLPHAADLKRACAARESADELAQALRDGDAAALLALWDETWHPLFEQSASLAPGARRIVQEAFTANPPALNATLVRLGPDHVQLAWDWPPMSGTGGIGQVAVVDVFGNHHEGAASARDAPDHVLTVFKAPADTRATLDLAHAGRRCSAVVHAGWIFAGQVVSAPGERVEEPRLRLFYRSTPAGWSSPVDILHLTADRPIKLPTLDVVDIRTDRPVLQVSGARLDSGSSDIELTDTDGKRMLGTKLRHAWSRLVPFGVMQFRLQLAEAATNDGWIEIVHPGSDAQRRLIAVSAAQS